MPTLDFTQPLANARALATETSTTDRVTATRLLVVDDNTDGRVLLGKILESVGYSVKLANDAAEALRLAEAGPFDLVISDIGLPGMDGMELMTELRSRFSLRGIALTGFERAEDTQRGRVAGFSEFLVKPVDIAQLDEAIRRVMTQAHSRPN